MFSLTANHRYFFYPFPTDMRKSFDTLSGIVTNQMGMNVQNGDAFIFANRTLTNLKVLHAEYGGLVIYNLRLERGRLQLPAVSDAEVATFKYKINFSDLVSMVRIAEAESHKSPSHWKCKPK